MGSEAMAKRSRNEKGNPLNKYELYSRCEVITKCGEEARDWLGEFEKEGCWSWAEKTFEAVRKFRDHHVSEGFALLQEVAERLAVDFSGQGSAKTDAPLRPSIRHLLRRWYLSAMAYYHYLNGEVEEAQKSLRQAHAEIRAALSEDFFLLPFVTACVELRLQGARIARRRNRWPDVKRLLGEIRSIYFGELPFCVLEDGRAVYRSTLLDFYRGLPLTEEEKKGLLFTLEDDEALMEWLDRIEEELYTLPDFVIPYP